MDLRMSTGDNRPRSACRQQDQNEDQLPFAQLDRMVKLRNYYGVLLVVAALSGRAQSDSTEVVPLANAHAHNDYEHARPLYDALDQGFTSVEADVYTVG